MKSITVRAHAKINWMLRVLRRRDDGYHEIETIFQAISLHDTLEIHRDNETRLVCSNRRLPHDRRNLVLDAVERLREVASFGEVRIHLDKKIPIGGGLGGGSSDAAATLLAIDRLFNLDVPFDTLRAIAADLGSDAPFFLRGGAAWGAGRGEILEPLPDIGRIPLLLILPSKSMSTREAYAALGRTSEPSGKKRGRAAWSKVVEDGLLGHAEELGNDFEEPFFRKHPGLLQWREALERHGAKVARLSGSGSTIFGAFDTAEGRDAAAIALGKRARVVKARTLDASES